MLSEMMITGDMRGLSVGDDPTTSGSDDAEGGHPLQLQDLVGELAKQHWSPGLPFSETQHLRLSSQLFCLRNLGIKRDLLRFETLMLKPEMSSDGGRALRQRWFICFRLYATFNSLNGTLDRSFLLPFLSAKVGGDRIQDTVERMVRWLDKREKYTNEILSAEAMFNLEEKSAWAVKSAYGHLKSSFASLKEVVQKHMQFAERVMPPAMEENITEREIRNMLTSLLAHLYEDASSGTTEVKNLYLGYIFLHLSGPDLRGAPAVVSVVADATQAKLREAWMPEVRALYFDVLYGLAELPVAGSPKKGGFIHRLLKRGGKHASSPKKKAAECYLHYAHARSKLLHSGLHT